MNTISFPNMFNKNKYTLAVSLSEYIKSINESLTSLIMTNPGELLGDPAYGCGLRQKLFDIKYDESVNELKLILVQSIKKYVPTIYVDNSSIKIYSSPNNNHYKITINYMIKQYNENGEYELVI